MLKRTILPFATPILSAILCLLWFIPQGQAQLGFVHNDSIIVKANGDTLFNAWAGGLNYAQFSDFDYDFDGDMDLFVFDRSHDNIRVFLQETVNGEKRYKRAFNERNLFPEDVRYRATMVDYDFDGRKDLFCYGIGGLKVYRNVGDAVNGLQWELFQDLVYSQYPDNYSNLNVSGSDIPAIIDVDNDGDIDILTFGQDGRHVEYHQNQSMDLYGIPDSLIFIEKNECWGLFSEDTNTNDITLNDPNAPCVGGAITNPETEAGDDELLRSATRHSGSTLLALDMDASGVLDLVVGDASYTNMNMLINGGTAVNTNSAMISVENNFPANTTPIDIQLFPAAFYVDVDFDGVRDLIAAPNAKNVSFNERSVFYYKNLGADNNPTFVYLDDNFLQGEMIEHGTGSIPVLFDYNEDGLPDLMVADFFRYKPILDKESVVAYYQNTGTATQPEFTFVDSDVFSLAGEAYGLRSVPAFGDVDGDGDEDMFLGTENGSLIYYENQSTGSGAVFTTPVLNYTDDQGVAISTGGYAHPQLFDLNGDDLLDLILGKRNGEIAYYQNVGTSTTPSFQLSNPMLGGIDVSTTTPDGYAAPHFFVSNSDTLLFVGSLDGKLIYYSGISGNLGVGDTFTLESDNFIGLNVEAYSSFYVEDLDQDGRLNMFVGQDLGGIYHYEVDPSSNIGLNELENLPFVAVYPNPVGDAFTIATEHFDGGNYRIFDVNGKVMVSGALNGGQTSVGTATLASGFYLVRVTFPDGRTVSKKILK